MSTSVCEPPLLAGGDTPGPSDEAIHRQVWRLLGGKSPAGALERRREQRYPYPRLIMITPVGADGETPGGPSFAVAGKHLSERGLGFFHHQPLVHRRVIVSLETLDGRWLAFLLDIRRCRFTRQGWYESGGRFLRAVPSPLACRDTA